MRIFNKPEICFANFPVHAQKFHLFEIKHGIFDKSKIYKNFADKLYQTWILLMIYLLVKKKL